MEEQIFLEQGYTGNAERGLYVRNPLKEFNDKLKKQGKKIVGIVFDGGYNLEILTTDDI